MCVCSPSFSYHFPYFHRDKVATGTRSCKAALNLLDLFTKAESARAWGEATQLVRSF